jgi:rod shape-determining protein MreD
MRLIPYILLAYVALGVQTGMGRFLEWNGARPNIVLLAVIFVAVNAPRDAATLGCFGMGVLQDLLSQQPLGLHAMAYGLLAMMIGNTQSSVYRGHPLTHVSLAVFGGLVTGVVLYLHSLIWSPAPNSLTTAAVPATLGNLLLGILYTAVLAPFVIGILQRIRRAFAFQQNRRQRMS